MNETKHPFSLIAIKDTFNPYPNRFLLHYDKDWDCNLFFSFHTAFPEFEQSDTFEIDGITYKWLSIADMRKYPRIQAINMDVVDFVFAQIL